MEKRNENLRFENTTLEMREASVDEIEYYQAFEEYEDLPHTLWRQTLMKMRYVLISRCRCL